MQITQKYSHSYNEIAEMFPRFYRSWWLVGLVICKLTRNNTFPRLQRNHGDIPTILPGHVVDD